MIHLKSKQQCKQEKEKKKEERKRAKQLALDFSKSLTDKHKVQYQLLKADMASDPKTIAEAYEELARLWKEQTVQDAKESIRSFQSWLDKALEGDPDCKPPAFTNQTTMSKTIKISAKLKRTFSLREYENYVVEYGVEEDLNEGDDYDKEFDRLRAKLQQQLSKDMQLISNLNQNGSTTNQ